jgi:hypothetical protein
MSDKFKIKENRRDDLWNVCDVSEEVPVSLCSCPDHESAEEICSALNTRAAQAASDSVTISRECAESLLAVLDKGVSVYIDHDAATKLFGELKQALKN